MRRQVAQIAIGSSLILGCGRIGFEARGTQDPDAPIGGSAWTTSWVVPFQGIGSVELEGAGLATTGRTVVAGLFQDSLDVGSFSFTGDSADVFVAEIDPSGAVSGHLRASGQFAGTDFTLQGNGDVLAARLDANGDPIWARSHPGPGTEVAVAITVSPAGRVFIAGHADNAFALDGLSLPQPAFGTIAFVAEHDAGTGSVRWATQVADFGGQGFGARTISASDTRVAIAGTL